MVLQQSESRVGTCSIKLILKSIQECQGRGWNEKGHKSECKILRAVDVISS